jgi:hypothetical protein
MWGNRGKQYNGEALFMSNRRIFSGVAANIYGQGVTIVTQVVGVPIMIAGWGLAASVCGRC